MISAFLLPSRAVWAFAFGVGRFLDLAGFVCNVGRVWAGHQALCRLPDTGYGRFPAGELPDRGEAGDAVPDLDQARRRPLRRQLTSWHLPKFTNSGRGAVIVVQHATQALAPLDHACVSKMARFWADESVGQPLVIALGVIMGDEVVHGGPQ